MDWKRQQIPAYNNNGEKPGHVRILPRPDVHFYTPTRVRQEHQVEYDTASHRERRLPSHEYSREEGRHQYDPYCHDEQDSSSDSKEDSFWYDNPTHYKSPYTPRETRGEARPGYDPPRSRSMSHTGSFHTNSETHTGPHAGPYSYRPYKNDHTFIYQGIGSPPVIKQPSIKRTRPTNGVAQAFVMGDVRGQPHDRQWSTPLDGCLEDIPGCFAVLFCSMCYECHISARMGEFMCLPFCIVQSLLTLRMKIRETNHIKGSLLNDCFVTTFCPCMALCQIKRELDIIDEHGLTSSTVEHDLY